MDLEAYCARYQGETRLQRLLLVAQTSPHDALSAQAFDLLEEQLKRDGNVLRYKEVFASPREQQQQSQQAASEGAGREGTCRTEHSSIRHPSKPYDETWALEMESANRNARAVFQSRLASARSHLHKEAIRTAYMALAQHDAKTGALKDALGSLMRATDFCTSHTQTAQISLLILEAAFGLKYYPHVREYVHKVEHTLGVGTVAGAVISATGNNNNNAPSSGGLREVSIKLKMASGLERLVRGDYDAAGKILKTLCMTTSTASMEWPGVTCAADMALYASLLALASQDRSSILELAEHPEALELVPAMKDLLLQWCRANYVKCMEAFAEPSVSASSMVHPGDLYLSGSPGEVLRRKIRETCLVEYLKPYQCVRLDTMSQLFPSISNIQDTLADLIGRGLISNARIDCRANTLFKVEPKQELDLAGLEQRVLNDAHALLIRLACLENNLVVQNTAPRRTAATRVFDADDDSSDEEEDTHMIDSFAEQQNNAANPEDLY